MARQVNPDDSGEHPNADLMNIAAAAAAAYTTAWLALISIQDRIFATWPKLTVTQRGSILSQLSKRATSLGNSGTRLANQTASTVINAWHLGDTTQGVLLGDHSTDYTDTSLETLQSLVSDTTTSLLDATRFVNTSTKSLIRTLAAQHMNDSLEAGENPDRAAAKLVKDLAGRQITAVVYKNGAHVGLDVYADMVTRSSVAIAYQVGGFAQARAQGIQFMEIFDGPNCGWSEHDDPDLADGTIRTLDQSEAYPTSHRNCVRTSSARPDILSASDAALAGPSTSLAQRFDQSTVSAQRELAVARRAAARRLDAQVTRKANGILSDSSNRVTSPAAARGLARRQINAQRRKIAS